MMAKPTVRDIVEIVNGLEKVAQSLREASNSTPIEGQTTLMVPAQVKGLLEVATTLDLYKKILDKLIPEDEVRVEPDISPEK